MNYIEIILNLDHIKNELVEMNVGPGECISLKKKLSEILELVEIKKSESLNWMRI